MIAIRPATSDHSEILSELCRRTFVETFADDNRPEDIDFYTHENFNTAKQQFEIEDPKRRIAIAWVDGSAVGFSHLYQGEVSPSIKGESPIELLRLYVDAKWHGKGVGPALMNDCLSFAQREGHKTMWLGVWERNSRAQAFYRKYSFTEVARHIFILGSDQQVDLIFSRSISIHEML